MRHGIKIGALAAGCGVSRDTVRYYERLGLLQPPPRTPSQHRVYDSSAMERLRFIRGARRLGLTLEDINALLRAREEKGARAAERVLRTLGARAKALDLEAAKLRAFHVLLLEALHLCDEAPERALSILEDVFAKAKP
jgi:DNA-binding transcriptional MerR regulator